ncbi:MAG: pyrogallol hydroxytransferase large subunit, partial [Desulfamplus sp.]|nr:pyrogallol hydroxytransferase large subunit [Desulfamplus sp.]
IVRINSKDAKVRKIKHHDLVEVFNDRGSVICAADVTERLIPGTVLSCEGSAQYDPVDSQISAEKMPSDRGGCINLLTPSRNIIKNSHSSAPNSCLVQVRLWKGAS